MSSAIRCVSCKQKINLAPGSSGIVVCPMCKTQQPVPDEQGQHAPDLQSPDESASSVQSQSTPANITSHAADRPTHVKSPASQKIPFDQPSHTFGPDQSKGCGCLLAGLLITIPGFSLISLMVFGS